MRTGKAPRALPVIPGYTDAVKTAISVPAEIFDRVSQRSTAMGLSRSAFFARAAQRYLDELDAPRDSVVNATALATVNKSDLTDRVGRLPLGLMQDVDRGLRRALDL